MKMVWVTTWSRRCGIADYSRILWPAVERKLAEAGHEGKLLSLDESGDLVRDLAALKPHLIHFQHEYGIFGGKNPPFYQFPTLARRVRATLPETHLTATAHTVLDRSYRFPVRGRGIQVPARALANLTLLRPLKKIWGPGTWGTLDGVIVHSQLQVPAVKAAGAREVAVVPHFVPVVHHRADAAGYEPFLRKHVLVFGFFTPEKGQDIVIEAMARLSPDVRLTLAGGLRTEKDRPYLEKCERLIRELGLTDRVRITGFVEQEKIDEYYRDATLVVAPFRATTGSGSLVQAFARGVPVLASDLPLNREIAERQSGALAFFRSEDSTDCASRIQELLSAEGRLSEMRESSRQYAAENDPDRIALRHLEFFARVTGFGLEEDGR